MDQLSLFGKLHTLVHLIAEVIGKNERIAFVGFQWSFWQCLDLHQVDEISSKYCTSFR